MFLGGFPCFLDPPHFRWVLESLFPFYSPLFPTLHDLLDYFLLSLVCICNGSCMVDWFLVCFLCIRSPMLDCFLLSPVCICNGSCMVDCFSPLPLRLEEINHVSNQSCSDFFDDFFFGHNGLIAFQCIPMGNGASTYDHFELRPSS